MVRGLFVIAMIGVAPLAYAADVDAALSQLAQAGTAAGDSEDTRAARDVLVGQNADFLPRLLAAMDTDNPVAANWYRTVFDEIAAREAAGPQPKFPRAALEAFVRDAKHRGRPRRLALALLDQIDAKFREKQLPEWLADPEFGDDAVAHLLVQGDQAKGQNDTSAAAASYRRAFDHARDSDQVLAAAARLRSVGVEVDPVRHLGFVTRWHLTGPFDAPEMTGFARVFPPEEKLDLDARYPAGDGNTFGWRVHQTTDALGQVNLIQALAATAEAVGYAYAEVDAPRAQPIQLRCSADDNLTVWLNGRRVLAKQQWLNGTRLDRFVVPVRLEAGVNRLLVKICQGPQHVDPAVPNNWSFQLRLCDERGGGAEFRVVNPAPDAEGPKR